MQHDDGKRRVARADEMLTASSQAIALESRDGETR